MTHGYISKYLKEENYGFIEDYLGNSYFFHKNDIINKLEKEIEVNLAVIFEEVESKKGLCAKSIELKDKINRYEFPTHIMLFEKDLKGYEIFEGSEYYVSGSSSESYADAKENLRDILKIFGANAGVLTQYYKTTGSRPGTGSGTYYFTVHNFKCVPVNIAKRSSRGTIIEDINTKKTNLNGKIELMEQLKKKKTYISMGITAFYWLIVFMVILMSFHYNTIFGIPKYFAYVGLIILAFFFGTYRNHHSWIQKLER